MAISFRITVPTVKPPPMSAETGLNQFMAPSWNGVRIFTFENQTIPDGSWPIIEYETGLLVAAANNKDETANVYTNTASGLSLIDLGRQIGGAGASRLLGGGAGLLTIAGAGRDGYYELEDTGKVSNKTILSGTSGAAGVAAVFLTGPVGWVVGGAALGLGIYSSFQDNSHTGIWDFGNKVLNDYSNYSTGYGDDMYSYILGSQNNSGTSSPNGISANTNDFSNLTPPISEASVMSTLKSRINVVRFLHYQAWRFDYEEIHGNAHARRTGSPKRFGFTGEASIAKDIERAAFA